MTLNQMLYELLDCALDYIAESNAIRMAGGREFYMEARAALTTASPAKASPGQKWKSGNEWLPFHPQASHCTPDYRSGWNDAYAAALAATAPEQKPLGYLTAEAVTQLQSKEMWPIKSVTVHSALNYNVPIYLAAPQQAAPAIPPGYVLVPVEPTEEMTRAANKLPDLLDIGDEWRAMIAAAPPVAQREESRDAKNAQRYRWLRDKIAWTVTCANDVARFSARIPVPTAMLANDTSNELDAAIDFAIAAAPKEPT